MWYSPCIAVLSAAAAAKSHQSCLTLCDHIDCSPPGSHLWDSPGKNTGVSCHFLLQCMKVKSENEVAQPCPTLHDPPGLQPTRLLRPWDFPGKSTGVGCLCLLCMKVLLTPNSHINNGSMFNKLGKNDNMRDKIKQMFPLHK